MVDDLIKKSLDFGIILNNTLVDYLLVGTDEKHILVTLLEGSSVKLLPTQYGGAPIKYEFMTQAEYDAILK